MPFGELVAVQLLLVIFVGHEQSGVDIALVSFELLLRTVCMHFRDLVRKSGFTGEVVGLHPQHGAKLQAMTFTFVTRFWWTPVGHPILRVMLVTSWLKKARHLHSVELGAGTAR